MSNKFLKYRGAKPSAPRSIPHDLPCAGCGYNLRGLTTDRKCPECGQPMNMDIRPPDVLLRGDIFQRRRTRLALGMMAGCLIVAAMSRLVLFVGLIALPWPIPSEGYIGLGLAMSAAWACATWMLLPKELDAWLGLPQGLRILARHSQFLWIAGYVCWLLADTVFFGTASEEQWYVAAVIIRGIAGAGAMLVFVVLMAMASQAELEDAARRIHLAIWMIALPTLTLIFIPSTIPWVAVILVAGPVLWWCWTLWMIGRSVWQMHNHVAWDLKIEADRPRRQERVNDARQRMDRKMDANVRPVDAARRGDLPVDG